MTAGLLAAASAIAAGPAATPPETPEIVLWGDPILEQEPPDDGDLGTAREVVAQLKAALATVRGYALAAPQIGVQMLIAYVKIPPSRGKPAGEDFAMIAPRITYREKRVRVMEGCLSIPGFFHTIDRFHKIRFEYTDLDGKLVKRSCAGLLAQVIQHECEHLEGRLMIDHVHDRPARRQAKRCVEEAQAKARKRG